MYTVNEGPGTVTITVNWTLTATSDSGGPAGAVAGADYQAASGVLSFGPKETAKTFTVQTHAVTGNHAVTLTLSGPSPGSALGAPGTATLWIVGDSP
jgi:hypothetical protein